MKGVFLFVIALFAIVGCTQTYTTHNPTPTEILNENKDADIFFLNETVYKNASDIDWVKALDLSTGDEVGEISHLYKHWDNFINGMATKLPIGTKIYELKQNRGPVLVAIVNGEKIPYLGIVEG